MACFVVLPSFFFFRARTILFLIFATKPIIFIFITLTYFYASRVFKVAALKRTLGKTVVQRTFEFFNAFHFSFNGLICWTSASKIARSIDRWLINARGRGKDRFLIGLSIFFELAVTEGNRSRPKWENTMINFTVGRFKTTNFFPRMNKRYSRRYIVKVENLLNKSLKHELCNKVTMFLLLPLLFSLERIKIRVHLNGIK